MDSISSPPQQIQQASTWGSKSFFSYWCLHRQPARSQLTAYNEGMLYCEMWRQNLRRCFSSQLLTMTHPHLNWMGRRGVILTSNVPTLQDICMQNSHWLSVSNFDRHGSYRIIPPRFRQRIKVRFWAWGTWRALEWSFWQASSCSTSDTSSRFCSPTSRESSPTTVTCFDTVPDIFLNCG